MRKFPALIFALSLAAGVAFSATLVNDPFSDGSCTNSTGGDLLGLIWYRSTTSTGAPLTVGSDAAGIGTGNALLFTPNADGQKLIANFPATTLANAGDTLRMSFDYRFTSAPPSAIDGFRMGLFSSNGTRQSSDGGGSVRNNDVGYVIAYDPGASGSFQVRQENQNGSDDILGGSVYFNSITTNTASAATVVSATTKHTITLTITRLANGDLQSGGQMDGLTATAGTLAAASVLTYSLDEFAIGFAPSGSVYRPFYLDNLRIVRGSAGSVALTAPTADSVVASPAVVTLSATASDPDGIARVEFYDGTTKLGQAVTAPYSMSWSNAPGGVHALTAVLVDGDGEPTTSAPVDIRVTGAATDAYDTLRARWLAFITGGTSYNVADSDIANRITSITSGAQTNWNNMDKSVGRTFLWSDAASATISADISTCYSRLRGMALAYATTGSTLRNNAALLADLASALDWLNANRYRETVSPYDNWYDWEIGTPQSLNDIVVLLYDQLSPTRVMNQMRAIERFDPTAELFTFSNSYNTGANRTDKDIVVALRGVLVKDSAKLFAARDSLSPVFDLVTSGDGFYADGSFIQHNRHPYNGGYGADLIDSLAGTLTLLRGSTWDVVDPDLPNVYRWIYNSYEPFLFRGAMMDSVRGRGISRSGSEDHARGHGVMTTILQLAQIAPATDALEYRRLVKALIQADSSRNFLTANSLPATLLAKDVLADGAVTPRPEPVADLQFGGMDRVVHWRPGFAFAVSMSSTRVYNYESINTENLHGWHTGNGATYLYDADIDEYSSAYWPTVNPYRLAGTTVDTQTLANGTSQSTLGVYAWAGGAKLLGLYGSAGMELDSHDSSLTARKSWFMFDDEIVALGSGITSTDSRTIETIVENRRLKVATSALTVDGVAKSTALGWSETMTGVGWAHLAATGGYVFPGGATLKGLREARTGAWQDINGGGSATANTRNFATLWFDHGINPSGATYAYTVLPNKTAAETSAYAANPSATILENSAVAHGVRETTLGIEAINFWTDSSRTVGTITCDRKAAVLAHNSGAFLDLAIADPTQANTGAIVVEIAARGMSLVSADPGVTVQQLAPNVRVSVAVSGAGGKTFAARFRLAVPLVTIAASDATASESGGDTGTFLITRDLTSGPLTVGYSLAGSALAGFDYASPAGSVTFADGEASKSITITPFADRYVDAGDTVVATLTAGSGFEIGTPSTATITITDGTGTPFSVLPKNPLATTPGGYGTATRSLVSVAGQPFAQALRIVTPDSSANVYEAGFSSAAQVGFTQAVSAGDVVLVSLWARAVSGDANGEAFLSPKIESTAAVSSGTAPLTLTGAWRFVQLPFTMAGGYAAGGARLTLFAGYGPQTVEIGGITIADYGPVAYSALGIPFYEGSEANAAWRSAAAQRIEQNRKADLTVQVRDLGGNPLPGATVRVQMKRHAFGFGSAVQASRITSTDTTEATYVGNQIYRDKIRELFNWAVFENDLKWSLWEPTRDNVNSTTVIAALGWLRDQRLNGVRGHNLIWPAFGNMPGWVQTEYNNQIAANGPAAADAWLRARVLSHITNEAAAVGTRAERWDVLNEPFANHALQDLYGRTEIAAWYLAARAAAPAAKLVLNDYGNHGEDLPHVKFDLLTLRETDAGQAAPLIDGIGIQSHLGIRDLPAPDRVLTVFDRYAALGKQIEITEFDVDTNGDEQLQADYLRDYLTACFSHPSVKSFLHWGFWETAHWKPPRALYRADWSIKPNGQVWKELVYTTWWTDVTAVADASGNVTVRGFLGDYDISATTSTRAITVPATLSAGGATVAIVPRAPANFALAPLADTYAQDSTPTTNYGTATTLITKKTTSTLNRTAYLKFDLSAVPEIFSARLRLDATLSAASGSTATLAVQTSVWSVADTAWSETALNWNNRPALGVLLDNANVTGTMPAPAAQSIDLDVTAYLQGEKAAGRNVVSLALQNATVSVPSISFVAREAVNAPQLVITAAQLPTIVAAAPDAAAAELGANVGAFRLTRDGDTSVPLTVSLALGGTAVRGVDYTLPWGNSATFAAGSTVANATLTPIADALAEGPETAVLTLQPGTSYSLGAPASATVQIADLPFDDWRFSRGLGSVADAVDTDRDGRSNLLEYATGTDPLVSGPPPYPIVARTVGVLTLTYQRLRDPAEISYFAEVSSDLVHWNSGLPYVQETLQPDNVTVIARDLGPTSGARFMRLHILRFP